MERRKIRNRGNSEEKEFKSKSKLANTAGTLTSAGQSHLLQDIFMC